MKGEKENKKCLIILCRFFWQTCLINQRLVHVSIIHMETCSAIQYVLFVSYSSCVVYTANARDENKNDTDTILSR